jgi:hypothetical protein
MYPWRFLFYIAQWRFAEALAKLEPGLCPDGPWDLWAKYRLGLYKAVSESRWNGVHLKGGIAKVVSMYACGRVREAVTMLDSIIARHGKGKYLNGLADALAPFDHLLALSLLERLRQPNVLYVALLLRAGQLDTAASKLSEACERGFSSQPELWLISTNVSGGGPSEQLARLNKWFAHFRLPPLVLLDSAKPPAPGNLRMQYAPKPFSGGPLVTVLMTSFNSAEYIEGALEGLLNQSWQNLEIIVADDASEDDTAAIVQAVSARDARVKLLRLPCNVGTYAAKTAALKLAQGEFVTCHDSDDWSHPLRIELQVQPLLRNPRLVATTSQWVRMEDSGHFYARPVHPLTRLNPASPLFRREVVVKQTGGWDCVRTGADSEFHARLRLVFGRRAVLRIKLPLTLGLHRPNSLMTAADTGYSATGISPTRLAYWESWTHWHIDCLRNKQPLRMPAFDEPRAFAAPEKISVNIQHVQLCMQAAENACALLR